MKREFRGELRSESKSGESKTLPLQRERERERVSELLISREIDENCFRIYARIHCLVNFDGNGIGML